MRYLFLIVISLSSLFSFAQTPENSDTIQYKTVFAELLGHGGYTLKGFSSKVNVEVDFGDENKGWWYKENNALVDDEGKKITFNSMVDAMNYMGERGWKFETSYVVTIDKQHVIHWLMSKEIPFDSDSREGIKQKKDFQNKKKDKKKPVSAIDPIYGN